MGDQLPGEIYKSIFENSDEAILVVDQSGKIVAANEGSLGLFKYDSLVGRQLEILIPREKREMHHKHRDGFTKSPSKRSMGMGYELEAVRKDGSRFPVSIGLSYIKQEEGMLAVAFVVDISKQHDIREHLKELNSTLESRVQERTKELASMVNKLEHANDELIKKENELKMALSRERELGNMKSRFVSMASHEFRTPLSSILSSVSLIDKYKLSEQQDKRDKHINRIKANVGFLTNILNDFLSLDKLQTGKVSIQVTDFNLCELAMQMVEDLQDNLKEGQSINLNQTENCTVRLDNHLLRTIIINLLSNASKYSNEGQSIEFSIKENGSRIVLKIKDHGIGIPESDQKHMFDRFFRAENVTNIQGTGLGLNLTKGFVELMRGTISFTSMVDEGTEFVVELPKAL